MIPQNRCFQLWNGNGEKSWAVNKETQKIKKDVPGCNKQFPISLSTHPQIASPLGNTESFWCPSFIFTFHLENFNCNYDGIIFILKIKFILIPFLIFHNVQEIIRRKKNFYHFPCWQWNFFFNLSQRKNYHLSL